MQATKGEACLALLALANHQVRYARTAASRLSTTSPGLSPGRRIMSTVMPSSPAASTFSRTPPSIPDAFVTSTSTLYSVKIARLNACENGGRRPRMRSGAKPASSRLLHGCRHGQHPREHHPGLMQAREVLELLGPNGKHDAPAAPACGFAASLRPWQARLRNRNRRAKRSHPAAPPPPQMNRRTASLPAAPSRHARSAGIAQRRPADTWPGRCA